MKIGDIVVVKMTYEEFELVDDGTGRLVTKKAGERTEQVVDKIIATHENGVILQRCHVVSADKISYATADQINEYLQHEMGIANMLIEGDKLVENINEPEYL